MTSDWYDPDHFPELREAPPWVMQEMIEAEPALAERIVAGGDGADPAALALLARGEGPLAVVGCGTSEHGSLGVAEMLREAGVAAVSRGAFEAYCEPQRGGAVIGVSHEGGTWATVQALQAARAAGSATGLITARPESESTRHADAVLATPFVDRSWCHTVGYLSPLCAGLALAGAASGAPADAAAAGRTVAAGLESRAAAATAAQNLHGCAQLLIVGGGADRTSARELVLKIEEACHLPTAMRDLETLLHGHLPATGPDTGVVLVLCDRRAQDTAHRPRAGGAAGMCADRHPLRRDHHRPRPGRPGARRRRARPGRRRPARGRRGTARGRGPAAAPDARARPRPRHESRPDPARAGAVSRGGQDRRGELVGRQATSGGFRRLQPVALVRPQSRRYAWYRRSLRPSTARVSHAVDTTNVA